MPRQDRRSFGSLESDERTVRQFFEADTGASEAIEQMVAIGFLARRVDHEKNMVAAIGDHEIV
jgi:hypothetical protein